MSAPGTSAFRMRSAADASPPKSPPTICAFICFLLTSRLGHGLIMAQPEVGSGQFGNGEEVFCVLFVARGQSDCGVPECVLMPRRGPLTGPSSIYRVRREKRSMVAADRASGSHPNSPIPIRFVAVGFGAKNEPALAGRRASRSVDFRRR